MSRDVELVKMVGTYLVAHANLNYVDLQDMVDTIQASSYRYSRMKKQVFSNLVRRAYQSYCEQNNLVHDPEPSGGAAPGSGNASSDSDVEIEDPTPSTAMKTQMTNLYMSSSKPTEATPPRPARLPFRPAFEVPPSRAAQQSGQRAATSPICSDSSSKSDGDDLEIIEEVQSSQSRKNGTARNRSNSNDESKWSAAPKILPAKVVQTLQPIIRNISSNNESASRNKVVTVSATIPTNVNLTEATATSATTSEVSTGETQPMKVMLLNADGEEKLQLVQKRGPKRKLEDTNEGIGIGLSIQSPLKVRTRARVSNVDAVANLGLAAGTASKKIKKQVAVVEDSGVTFSDFGGNDKIIEEICKLLMHLKHPEIYRELGVVPPRGFLLHGAPGCGKTLLANAIAGELKMPLLKVAATELISGISGESENNIRDLFEQAVGLAPCIIFIDEIDSITPKRETAQREMERRIVSQLLTCIDDLGSRQNGDQVLLIGATNRIETIDVALRRAGRFDREICLGIPDVKAREQILRVLFRNLRLSPDFDFSLLARLTPGYVGADLQALMREAAVQAVDKVLSVQRGDSLPKNQIKKETQEVTSFNTPAPTAIANTTTEPKEQQNGEVDKATDMGQAQESTQANLVEKGTDEEPLIEPNMNNDSAANEPMEVCSTEPEEPEAQDPKPADVTGTVPAEAKLDKPADVTGTVPDEAKFDKPADVAETVHTQEDIVNKPAEKDFLKWIRDTAPVSESNLENLCLHMEDFEKAVKYVQPSSKREGFATVPDTTWDDIGALTEIREELQVSILGPVKHASSFQSLGLNSPAGVLLCGPPGCGKTLLAKAVANEAGINFISVKGPELLNMYVGESERAVRQCFLRAKNSSPCVIFFDELDALCPRRSDGVESGSTSRVVNQLLTEMDGMESRAGVFVMAATNRPDIIDPAILRPGRLDKIIFVNLPTPTDRFDILKAITKNGTMPRFADDVDLKAIALSDKLDGFTGADLAAIVREASIAAFRELILEAGKADKPVCRDNDLKVFSRHFDIALLRTKPSVTTKDREKYSQMKERYSSLLT